MLLKDVTGGLRRAEVPGATVGEVIAELDRRHPGFKQRVCNGDRLSPIVAVTVDGQIARDGLATAVRADSEVCFLPSFGGG